MRHFSFTLILLLLWPVVVNAQDQLGLLTPIPPPVGVMMPVYAGPRIGDIAPQFTLPPLIPRPDGKAWSSRAQMGQKAVLLVLIGESPVLTGQGNSPTALTISVVEAAEALEAQNVATVVVSQATGIKLSGLNPRFDGLTLRDEKSELNNYYSASPTGITLIGLDRAGFLRHVETLDTTAQVGAAMRRIGNVSPVLAEGLQAPDFTISDMNGRVRRLSELRGQKNLLLTFFPKCFTGGCANHLTSLQENLPAFAAADTEIWAVSVDSSEGKSGQREFARLLGLQFPLIPDTGRNLSILFDAARRPYNTAWRRTMLIDKDGFLRFIDKQVNVLTQGSDTLTKLRELGMAK